MKVLTEIHPLVGYEAQGVERTNGGPFLLRSDVQLLLQTLHAMTDNPDKQRAIEVIAMLMGVDHGAGNHSRP